MEFIPRESSSPALDPASGRVVVGTRDGILRSVTIDGRVRWQLVTTPSPFSAGVLIHDGVVYSPGGDGHAPSPPGRHRSADLVLRLLARSWSPSR